MKQRQSLFLLNSHARGTAPTLLKIQNSVERAEESQASFFLKTKGVKRSYRVICHGLEKPEGRSNRFITVWGEVIGETDGWVSHHVDVLPDKAVRFFTAIVDVQSPMFDRNGPCVVWFSKRGGLFYRYRKIRREFLDGLKEVVQADLVDVGV